ncbi:MAG TPA: hypothetical protein VK111_06510 [Virgibacillus sp.]|nr:hypothetical protein [Virgibacillus sp.]
MDLQFNQPKTFKELIDMISMFISKHFKKLFLIIICLAGPLLILQYIFLFLSKKPFIANMMGSDDMRLKILETLSYPVMEGRFEFYARIVGYSIFIVIPFVFIATILALSHRTKNGEFTVGSVIKDSLTAYSYIISGSFGFFILAIIAYFFPTIVIEPAVTSIIKALPTWGAPLSYALVIGIYVIFFFVFMRIVFFVPNAYEGDLPGYRESWYLTRNKLVRTMAFAIILLGIFLVFQKMLESISIFLVGDSILLIMIMDAYYLISLLFFAVSYAFVYMDLETIQRLKRRAIIENA